MNAPKVMYNIATDRGLGLNRTIEDNAYHGLPKDTETLLDNRSDGDIIGGDTEIYDKIISYPIDYLHEISIKTPYEKVVQVNSVEALRVKEYVEQGGMLYRGGTIGRSETTIAQFWATENPLTTPDYANKYGVDFTKLDYIVMGKLKPGATVVTRPAVRLRNNMGGAIEVITEPGSVEFEYFYMIGEENSGNK